MPGGKSQVLVEDAPFDRRVPAGFASKGTLQLLALLASLHDPVSPPFVAVEHPERSLHPRLLYLLAEEFRSAAAAPQWLVTTHSPFFLDAFRPEEIRLLWRDESGHTQCRPLGESRNVTARTNAGGELGELWMEGHFGVGDPLTAAGMPVRGYAAY